MNRGNEKKFIEVSEDAYKQNWVYRPWPEEKAVNNAAGRGKDDVDARPVDYKRAVSA